MKYLLLILSINILAACATQSNTMSTVTTATPYIGLEERQNRKELRELTGVDPVRTEWCAAFVNAILELEGIPGSESVSDNPLMARSFLDWGTRVEKVDVQKGDIVVFPRGNQGWQGHVGFYVQTQVHNGKEYWLILGGNQDNKVRYDLYPANRVIGIRRFVQKEVDSHLY
jgi:uncharacterized protein (TIGR02594 family)